MFPELVAAWVRAVLVTMQGDRGGVLPGFDGVSLLVGCFPEALVGCDAGRWSRLLGRLQDCPALRSRYAVRHRLPGAYAYRFPNARPIRRRAVGYFGPLVGVPFVVDGAVQPGARCDG